MSCWVVCIVTLCSIVATCVNAQSARPKNPAFEPPEVTEGLPHVLLIGDSISIGYMLPVRDQLKGEANVWRPPTNCGPSSKGIESLDEWLGDRQWDVVHFNHGLHDLKYMGPNGQNLADPAAATSYQQVPIPQYKKNLKQIAERLKATGATVIWCETTPVPKGSKGRVVGDAKKYNQAAAEVISELGGIETDPLYDFAMKHSDQQRPANVHYTPEGSRLLASQVANSIRDALSARK